MSEDSEIGTPETVPLLHSAADIEHNRQRPSSLRFRLRIMTIGILLLVLLAVVAFFVNISGAVDSTPPIQTDLPAPSYPFRNPSYLARGRLGGVASEESTCSEIGVDILRENGTATDAAIGAAICVGTLNMFSSGIGGGGFAVIRPSQSADKSFKPISIDFRETAPAASHPLMFVNKSADASSIGGLSVGVPGELRGFEAAYNHYGGGVPWSRLFAPSIRLAQFGWRVTPELERRLNYFGSFMPHKSEWKRIFAPKGHLVRKGELISRPEYAKTLRSIAENGAGIFYHGRIAESLSHSAQKEGGIITPQDFATYRANITSALAGSYRDRIIYTTHAPSSGPVLLSLLNTLEPLDLLEEGRTATNSHRFLEALKYSFAHRTRLGDPAKVNVQNYLNKLITKEYGRETLANISDNHTYTVNHYNPLYDIKSDHGTTHISVIDQWGGAAAITTTVNLIFGSRVMDPETGVILNDEMNDFAEPNVPDMFGLRPSPYNYPNPGARPLSSMCASIMDDPNGHVSLAIGGSGGSRIFSSVAQVLLNLDWGYDLSHAIEEPRIHHQLLPATVFAESGYPDDILDNLHRRGHNISVFDINVGVAEVQAVQQDRDNRWIYAASDSRKHGRASAY